MEFAIQITARVNGLQGFANYGVELHAPIDCDVV